MFRPKKIIPKLAVAMLALTGCGDDGGGTGGSGAPGTGGTGGADGDNLNKALSTWCMTLGECFPNVDYNESVETCVAYHVDLYGLDASISAACEAAAISYFECGDDLTCADFYDYNDCDDEFDAADAACN
jgi:hypothetical protein